MVKLQTVKKVITFDFETIYTHHREAFRGRKSLPGRFLGTDYKYTQLQTSDNHESEQQCW